MKMETTFMSTKRKNYSAEFKAKVALEAIRDEKTLVELAAKYQVHPNLVTKWKRQAIDGMVGAFSGKAERNDASHEEQIKELHAKIGQLTVERDFLSKAFAR